MTADMTQAAAASTPDGGLDEARARAAAAEAAAAVDLELGPLRLLRMGSNVVFVNGRVLVRVAPRSASRSAVERAVAVAHWLEDVDVPAVRLIDVEQPVEAGGLLVTFWEYLGADDRFGSTADLARLLRRLHALQAPRDLDLPALDPFDRAQRRISAARLPEADKSFLDTRLHQLWREYAELRFALEPGVIHGDASVGNVLLDAAGQPRLIDLDGFADGPREWDLVLTALYYERFGWHTAVEYEAFCETYGVDVMAWDGYSVLADVREFLMVTWLAQKTAESPRLAAEASKRVAALRDGGSRRNWEPF